MNQPSQGDMDRALQAADQAKRTAQSLFAKAKYDEAGTTASKALKQLQVAKLNKYSALREVELLAIIGSCALAKRATLQAASAFQLALKTTTQISSVPPGVMPSLYLGRAVAAFLSEPPDWPTARDKAMQASDRFIRLQADGRVKSLAVQGHIELCHRNYNDAFVMLQNAQLSFCSKTSNHWRIYTLSLMTLCSGDQTYFSQAVRLMDKQTEKHFRDAFAQRNPVRHLRPPNELYCDL